MRKRKVATALRKLDMAVLMGGPLFRPEVDAAIGLGDELYQAAPLDSNFDAALATAPAASVPLPSLPAVALSGGPRLAGVLGSEAAFEGFEPEGSCLEGSPVGVAPKRQRVEEGAPEKDLGTVTGVPLPLGSVCGTGIPVPTEDVPSLERCGS